MSENYKELLRGNVLFHKQVKIETTGFLSFCKCEKI